MNGAGSRPSGPQAVFLFGPGGAGKTTIAKRAQSLLSERWLFFEVDKCSPLVVIDPALATVEDDRRMVRASLRAARAYVDEAFPTLIEMDLSSAWRRASCEEIFGDVRRMFIVLTARREVAMARVEGRGTDPRWFDWFETSYDGVRWDALPGSEVIDTSDVTPEDAAAQMVELIEAAR